MRDLVVTPGAGGSAADDTPGQPQPGPVEPTPPIVDPTEPPAPAGDPDVVDPTTPPEAPMIARARVS